MTTAETEYSRAKTSVWWDIENCEVPKGWDAHAIAQNVSSALLNMNFCGPVSISAYGDTNQIPHAVQQALSSTGVGLNHVPAGVKDASDKKILVDMLLWAVDNPAPANFMLISGDRDFSNALHQLSMRRYTILLAQPPRASAPLVAAAKNVWLWTSLASGGPPLTSGESSRLVNNGRCLVSNSEVSKDLVSEQAQSSKPTDSSSDARDARDNHVPRGLPQETRRNMLQNGRRATGESVASCVSFEAHHSDQRHASQAAFVASHKAQASVSAKLIQEAAFVPDHKAQANVSAKPILEAPFVASHKSQANVSAKPIHDVAFVASHKAQTNVSAKLIQEAAFVASHKAQTNVSAKLIQEATFVGSHKAQANFSAKPIQEAAFVLNPKAQAYVSAKLIQEPAFVASHKTQANVSSKPIPEVAFVASHKTQANVSSKPIQEAALVEPILCNVCQISCASKDVYARHTYGKRHRKNLELQSGNSENMSGVPVGLPKDVLEKPKNKKKNASEGRTKPNGDFPCRLCNVVCQSQVVFDSHLKGQKHAAMLSQSKALIDSKLQEKGVREKDQPREAVAEPKPNAGYACRLCNVVCQSQIVFDSHLRGKKHASMLSQSEEKAVGKNDQPRETISEPQLQSQNAQQNTMCFEKNVAMDNQSEALIGSKKLQEKGVGEKDQPREAIVEPQLQSPNVQENIMCFEKHGAMVNQSEALVNSRKLEGKVVREKVQPTETTPEPQSQSQNNQENTKFFEKQNEVFRELYGTSKSSVKEKIPSTKDWVETVFNGGLRCEFGAPEEARQCFDGIVKPINLSKGAAEKEMEVMVPRAIAASNKPAFVASDGAKSSVSTKPITKEPEVLQPVWCQVCQISCNSKVAYSNHTYGKKHRQNLELQSAKNESMSKGQANLSKENTERLKKVLCKNQTAFDSQNHAAMVKEQTEAHVDTRRTRQELEQALIVDSVKTQEELDQEKETTEENTLVKMDDNGFQGAQEDKEEVKEMNLFSDSLTNAVLHALTSEVNRESRIPKELRGCLDVIPERVQLPTDVNVTEKLEDESKYKPQPKPQELGKESAGLKEHPGVATKREENKVPQVDNFWTRLWGKKS